MICLSKNELTVRVNIDALHGASLLSEVLIDIKVGTAYMKDMKKDAFPTPYHVKAILNGRPLAG